VAESRPPGVNPSDAFLIPASEIVAHRELLHSAGGNPAWCYGAEYNLCDGL